MDWKKELDDIQMPDKQELKKLKQETPKHSKEFEEYFKRVVGKGFNFTRKELDDMKYSLKYSIQRWRIKGLVDKNELPDSGGRLIWSWKMTFDKEQTIKMVKSISKRINNYSISAIQPSGICGSLIVCSSVILLPSIIEYLNILILVLIITVAVLVA